MRAVSKIIFELRAYNQKCGKNGAVDGARTRDPRRDRPVL